MFYRRRPVVLSGISYELGALRPAPTEITTNKPVIASRRDPGVLPPVIKTPTTPPADTSSSGSSKLLLGAGALAVLFFFRR